MKSISPWFRDAGRDRCDLSSGRRIQSVLEQDDRRHRGVAALTRKYSAKNVAALLATDFDRAKLARRPLPHEALEQLVFDLLMGVR